MPSQFWPIDPVSVGVRSPVLSTQAPSLSPTFRNASGVKVAAPSIATQSYVNPRADGNQKESDERSYARKSSRSPSSPVLSSVVDSTCIDGNARHGATQKSLSAMKPYIRLYQYIGDTFAALWIPPTTENRNHKAVQPPVDIATGPGLAFIGAVKMRSFKLAGGMQKSDVGGDWEGRVAQQLVESFIQGHFYFSTETPKRDERESYRDKIAFYLVKRAACSGVSANDVLSTAVRLVAEVLVRHYECLGLSVEEKVEVVFCGDPNRFAPAIMDHVQDAFPNMHFHPFLRLTSDEWKDLGSSLIQRTEVA